MKTIYLRTVAFLLFVFVFAGVAQGQTKDSNPPDVYTATFQMFKQYAYAEKDAFYAAHPHLCWVVTVCPETGQIKYVYSLYPVWLAFVTSQDVTHKLNFYFAQRWANPTPYNIGRYDGYNSGVHQDDRPGMYW